MSPSVKDIAACAVLGCAVLGLLLATTGCARHWTAQVSEGELSGLRSIREDHGAALCPRGDAPLPVRQLQIAEVEGEPESASYHPPLPLREALAQQDMPPGTYHLEQMNEPNGGDYAILGLAVAGAGTLTVSGAIALIYLIPCLGPTDCAGVPSWDGWLAVGGLGGLGLGLAMMGIAEAVFSSGGGEAGPVTACHEAVE